jgi:hypothetical protein
MELVPGCTIGPAEVEAICKIDDHSYRNRWIVYAYHDLSQRLRPILGENASFCTFATWSSRIIGEQIRTDMRNSHLLRLRDSTRIPRWLKWVFRPLFLFEKAWRDRTHSSVGQVMGYGNRMIFHEIAYELSRFVDTYRESGPDTPWEEYRDGIAVLPVTDLFPAANLTRFQEGMHCYYRARSEKDPARKAELVLQGTILISSYEQARVDSVLRAALSLFPRRLLRVGDARLMRVSGCGGFVDVELRRRETPWRLRHRSPIRRGLARMYARRLTRSIMTVEIPATAHLNVPREQQRYEELRLGRRLNPLEDGTLYRAPLDTLRDPDTKAVFDSFDRSKGRARRCRARNWSHFDERMNFIANYFRARQADPLLFAELPYEYRIVQDMDVSDTRLDALRDIRDDEADALALAVAQHTGLSGRGLLAKLVEFGLGPEELERAQLPAELVEAWYVERRGLPCWADQQLLRDGQIFFQRFRVEIASALFNAALPKTYTAAAGARVLTQTADRLARDNNGILSEGVVTLVANVERRIAETGQMLLDVMGSDDGGRAPFSPDTHACQAALGVRLFHASVRHQLLHDEEPWNRSKFGEPINQEDLLGVLTAFTVIVIDAMDAMGVQFARADRIAYVHTWLVIGHLMGIDYECLFPRGSGAGPGVPPLDYEELRVVLYRVFTRHGRFSVDGCRLQKALLDVQRARMPWPLKGLPGASIRFFLGDHAADDLGVPPANGTRHLFKVMVPFNAVRTLTYHVDWFAWLIRRRTYRLYARYIKSARGNRPDWRLNPLKPPLARVPRTASSRAEQP